MAKDLNRCDFIGRLGSDPTIRYMPNGDAVASFSIACSDDYKDKNSGQKIEQTNWVNIVAFRKLAEVISEHLKKGSRIYVSGKQITRKWQDKNNQDRYTTEIIANEMQMLDSRPNQEAGGTGQRDPAPGAGSASSNANEFGDFYDDDIGF